MSKNNITKVIHELLEKFTSNFLKIEIQDNIITFNIEKVKFTDDGIPVGVTETYQIKVKKIKKDKSIE